MTARSEDDILSFFRPQEMEDFISDSKLFMSLENILRNPTNFKVYLLHGPPGLGKTSFARIFAKHLNILDTSDYIEVNCASTRGIDDAREVLTILQSAPMLKHKVVVLDEAHQLTNQAQHALLKGLEDVRSTNYVFICSTSPEELIDTIKSRSFQVNFKPKEFPTSFDELDARLRVKLIELVLKMMDKLFPEKISILTKENINEIILKYLVYNTADSFSVRQYIVFWYSLLLSLDKNASISEQDIKGYITNSISKYSPILLARFLDNKEKHNFATITWYSVSKKIMNLDSTVESARLMILNYMMKYMLKPDADLEYGTYVLRCFSRPMIGSDAKALMFLAFRRIYEKFGIDT